MGILFYDSDVSGGDLREKVVTMRGLVVKKVITQAAVDANNRRPEGPHQMMGAGTTYWLTGIELVSVSD